MFKIKFSLLVVLGVILTVHTQEAKENINNYKYVIVPVKYDFLKEADMYQLNSLSKFLFEKYGFTAFMENEELPKDYKKDNCLGMKSDVISDGGIFKTKLMVQLKNCEGKVLYETKVGETREKDYKTAYHLALRDAFTSLEALNYKYIPNQKPIAQQTVENIVSADNTQAEIEKLRAEIEELKSETEKPDVGNQSEMKVVAGAHPSPGVVEDIAVTSTIVETSKEAKIESPNEILYAQATDDGYQLVDSTPKIVYKLKKTGSDSMFLVESINGVLTKKGNSWVLEYYDKGNLIQKELKIKF